MAYDKAKWHYGGNFPAGLEPECGGTHIGMFLAWAAARGMAGEELVEGSGPALDALRSRQMTGREFLFNELDGVLTEDDLDGEGNAFAAYYYETYQREYDELMKGRYPTAYHVEDTWPNFDAVAAMIDKRHQEWVAKGRPQGA
jgi:hypothetical protein